MTKEQIAQTLKRQAAAVTGKSAAHYLRLAADELEKETKKETGPSGTAYMQQKTARSRAKWSNALAKFNVEKQRSEMLKFGWHPLAPSELSVTQRYTNADLPGCIVDVRNDKFTLYRDGGKEEFQSDIAVKTGGTFINPSRFFKTDIKNKEEKKAAKADKYKFDSQRETARAILSSHGWILDPAKSNGNTGRYFINDKVAKGLSLTIAADYNQFYVRRDLNEVVRKTELSKLDTYLSQLAD